MLMFLGDMMEVGREPRVVHQWEKGTEFELWSAEVLTRLTAPEMRKESQNC